MDASTLLHTYIIPNAGPIATVFAASVAALVAVTFGTLQWLIARKQAATAQTSVQNALKLGNLQLEIAMQQAETAGISAKIARNKLRLDLFARRVVAYEAILKWMMVVPKDLPFSSEEFKEVLVVQRSLAWIFSQEVADWVTDELFLAAQKLVTKKQELNLVNSPVPLNERQRKYSEFYWEFEQQFKRLHEEFSPYLKIEE